MLDSRVLILGKDEAYRGYEQDMQQACARVLFYQYSKWLWFHPPNEGKHKVQYRKKQKNMGVKAGISDLIILEPKGGYSGLLAELKVKGGKPTQSQINVLNKAAEKGYLACICYNVTAFEQLMKDYKNGLYTKEAAQTEG